MEKMIERYGADINKAWDDNAREVHNLLALTGDQRVEGDMEAATARLEAARAEAKSRMEREAAEAQATYMESWPS